MIGKIVSHYKILEKIGSGGMGVVYKAQDLKLDRFVALKFFPPYVGAEGKDKQRFFHEAKAAAALEHNNICNVYEVDETEDGQRFIVMAYYEGETLKQKIEQGPLNLEETLDIVLQVSEGLHKAHEKGIVHRDVKPANIFVTNEGVVKILDFGLAKLAGHTKLTKSGTTFGTVVYMSPEQTRGVDIDHRTDIWSLGVVLYEMITGQLPFKGEYEQAVIYSILNEEPEPLKHYGIDASEDYQKIVTKALSKNLEERYQTVSEFISDLFHYSGITRGRRIPKVFFARTKRRRMALFVAIALLILLLSIVGYFIKQSYQDRLPILHHKDLYTQRVVSEEGENLGKISPEGNYIAYRNTKSAIIKLKERNTGITREIAKNAAYPNWSLDNTKIAYGQIDSAGQHIVISDISGIVMSRIPSEHMPWFLNWSPDGSRFVYLIEGSYLIIRNIDGRIEHKVHLDGMYTWPTFSPDSRKIVLIDGELAKFGVFRLLDVNTGIISDTLKGAVPYVGMAWWGGMAWSPDGRCLIYVGQDERENLELFALPTNPNTFSAEGTPIQITHLGGEGIPGWPGITNDGKQVNYSRNIDNWDIYVMSFNTESVTFTGDRLPVATDREYDGEPSWMPDGKGVLFVSNRDGQPDVYRYHFETEETVRLTVSEAKERYPQFSPDGQRISFYSDSAIWSIPAQGIRMRSQAITPTYLKLLGYYTWAPDGNSIYATIRDSSDTRYSILIQIDLEDSTYREILCDLFRPEFSFSPDGQQLVVSGLLSQIKDGIIHEKIYLYTIENGELRELLTQRYMSSNSRLLLTNDGKYLFLDRYDHSKNVWTVELMSISGNLSKKVILDSNLKERFFIQDIDPSGRKILVTTRSSAADIFVVGVSTEE